MGDSPVHITASVPENACAPNVPEAPPAPPAAAPKPAELEKMREDAAAANKALQSPGPPGSPTGKQKYDVTVPFGSTNLQMGAAKGQGGSGASLTTAGSILVDSVGAADIQAAGSMAIQSDAAMAAMSASGTSIGTPATIHVSAGGQIKLWEL